MKMKKLLSAMSLALGVTMLAGCGAGAGDNSSTSSTTSTEKTDLTTGNITNYTATDLSKNPVSNREDTLVIGTTAPDGVFNPVYVESTYDTYICESLFGYMLQPAEDGGDPEPYLSEYPEISEDGLTYKFKIKDEAKWSDGTPVTSADYAMAITIACDGTYDGPLDYISGRCKVKGAKEYHDGTASTISGIEIIDDKTVSVTLNEKSSSAIYVLGETFPVNSAYYGQYYTQGNTDGLKETYTNPGPSSGPYKFVSFKQGQEVALEANENFVLGTPKIKNLIYKVVNDEVKLSSLQAGDIDYTDPTVSTDNVETIETMGFAGYQLFPTNGYGYIAFNCARPQFQDKAVRQALTIGLNRAKIVDSVYNQYATVLNVPQSRASWAYSEGKNTYDYDLEAAKKLLDDAGWTVGSDGIREKDGVKLEINFTGTSNNEVVDSILSVADSDWKELGVKFTSEKMDFTSMRHKQEGGDWDMLFMAWGLTDDANDTVYRTNGSQNKTGFSNEKIDALYAQIDKELDKEKLIELYSELYTELNEELPYIYMYQRNDMYAYNGRVKGLDASPYRHFTFSLYKATLEE